MAARRKTPEQVLSSYKSCPRPLVLEPLAQHYEWGDVKFIPRLLGFRNPLRKPYAELWVGAHPGLPSKAVVDRVELDLAQLLEAAREEILGHDVASRFGGLPYLLKILSAARPLSIQAHPSKAQAEEGFARESASGIPLSAPERNYRDDNHKPELIVALTDFHGLCGFKPLAEIEESLEAFAASPASTAHLPRFSATPEGLRELYAAFMSLPQEAVDAILAPAIEALERDRRRFGQDDWRYWMLLADEEFCPHGGRKDRGLFSIPLLNLIHLKPGQGMYLPAGTLHAYLCGSGVEIMASSDNVLRGGLTRKHVDVPELLRTLDFEGRRPAAVEPVPAAAPLEWTYATPAEEFQLGRIEVDEGRPHRSEGARGAEILMVVELERRTGARVSFEGGDLMLRRGAAVLVPHGAKYSIEAGGKMVVYRASVPAKSPARRGAAETALPGSTRPGALRPVRRGTGKTGSGRPGAVRPRPRAAEEPSFRGRRPARLAFGTSGLRGLVTDITDLEAYINTRGFLDYLVETQDVEPGGTVSMAGDLRPSTDRILQAVARACADAGFVPENLGKIPTPALAFHAREMVRPCVMVTGSHIPFDRNGIKFYKSAGEVLKADEGTILRAVEHRRRLEYARPKAGSTFADDGSFRKEAALPPASDEGARRYVRRFLDFFPPGALGGKRLACYQHSAVGRDLLVEILEGLGAAVFPMGRSEEFVAVDTEDIGEDKLRALQALAEEACRRHGTIDAIVGTDGDSDRPLLASVDAEGRVTFHGGDLLGIVTADYLSADSISVPISSNDAVDVHFAQRGLKLEKTRIGSPYVIESMARSAGSRKVGWEANGGFLTGSPIERGGRILAPLPTRDAVLPLLAALHSSAEKGVSVGALFEALPARHGKAGLLDNVPLESSRAIIGGLSPSSLSFRESGLQDVEFAGGRAIAVVRDGHRGDPTPELSAEMDSIARRIRRHFTPERGFGDIIRINYIDGVRIFFENGDVAHVRPSGNAPQLRIYGVSGSRSRADEIVRMGIQEPDGILRCLEAALGAKAPPSPPGPQGGTPSPPAPPPPGAGSEAERVLRVRQNIALTSDLIERGETPEVIGCVSGSESARKFWARILERARLDLKTRGASSLHEDLPTNQAFGVLLLWQRLKPQLEGGRGALVAFVFGEGTRSSPLTETDNAQKPAIATPVRVMSPDGSRFLSMVELALRQFVPVQQYLRRSGFDGLVIKWGDEVQIPSVDLSGRDPRFQGADVVRFVSARIMDEDDAANKDWVGLDEEGRVTAFIPRRKLSEMEKLAERGLIRRKGGRLHGGVNLGSIAVSAALLDALLEEFRGEVNDASADRSRRPDLDPQFFTALTVAAIENPSRRREEWARVLEESKAIRKLEADMPGILDRLRRMVERFQESQGRSLRLLAMDCGEPYWGDIGQHPRMYEFYMALREEGPAGEISRALAGLEGIPADGRGNLMAGECRVAPSVEVERSVLIDAVLSGKGSVKDSVLIGTRAGDIRAEGAFDVLSVVRDLTLEPRGGTYKVVSRDPIRAAAGERLTTLFLPGSGPCLFKVREETPLQDKAATYDVPILGNPMSFREAHARMADVSVEDLESARRRAAEEALGP